MASLVEDLLHQALDDTLPIDNLLRKAKVVADKLDVQELREWVDRELNGYAPGDELPQYRKVHCELQAFNPTQGWQSILFKEPEKVRWLFAPRPVPIPVGQLQALSGGDSDSELSLAIPPNLKANLIAALEFETDVRCLLNRSQALGIPGQVRNKILDWALRLSRAGVRGEGFSFSQKERETAHTISINVHGNVENLSNVVDVAQGATVVTDQSVSKTLSGLVDLDRELRQHLDVLVPADQRSCLVEQLDAIDVESKNVAPDTGKLRRALTTVQGMIRDAAMSASTSLISQGALSLIADVLKHL